MTLNVGPTVTSQGFSALSKTAYINFTVAQATDYTSATSAANVRGRFQGNPFGAPYVAPDGSQQDDAAAMSNVIVVNQSGTVGYWSAFAPGPLYQFIASGPLSAPLALTMGQIYNCSAFSLNSSTANGITGTSPTIALAGVVASIIKVSGDQQGGTVGQPQAAPMIVQVLDASNIPVANATVNFTTSAGSLSVASATTDLNGHAPVTLTNPSSSGTTTVTAAIGSLSVTFTQACRILLYVKASPFPALLKPAGSGDPLAGGGFIPDTGEAFTLIPGLSDDFTQSALDRTKWFTRYQNYNGSLDHLNDECQRYVDTDINGNPVHVMTGNSLKLTARVRPGTTAHAPSSTGITYPIYDSAMIRAKTIYKYGYVEMRAKLPTGQGAWAAGWADSWDQKWPPEIDFLEFVLNGASEMANMCHANVMPGSTTNRAIMWLDPNFNSQWTYFKPPAGYDPAYFVADWHVWGAFWNQDNTVTIYIDGQPIVQFKYDWRHNDWTDGGYATLMADLAMGGSWPTNNFTTPITTDEQAFELDYIRVSQKTADQRISTATF